MLQSKQQEWEKHRLPPVVDLDNKGNGRYTHFGLECALAGDSPGLYHRHADLLQYAAIYKTNPKALPLSIRRKVHICLKFMYAIPPHFFVAIRGSGLNRLWISLLYSLGYIITITSFFPLD